MSRLYPLRKAIASAAVGSGAVITWSLINNERATSQCEAPPVDRVIPLEPEPSTAVAVSSLKRWLEHRGADTSGVDIKECDVTAGRFGVFANVETKRRTTPGLWTRLKTAMRFQPGSSPVASFPLQSTITFENILSPSTATATATTTNNKQTEMLRELVLHGTIDERTGIMLHLIVERFKRRDSALYPWISALPKTFDTPLFWSEQNMNWLQGTNLYKATMLRKKALEAQWQQLQPICHRLALQAGIHYTPSYADYLWAYSVFWSRSMSIPSLSSSHTSSLSVIEEEGIVPGLDFCNHSPNSKCKWVVFNAPSKSKPAKTTTSTSTPEDSKTRNQIESKVESIGGVVKLMCDRNARIKPGQEITIDYGNKSNEELLFHYGFALEHNPSDVLMLLCPIPPPSEWDDNLAHRIELLQHRGLKPQLFLPSGDLEAFLLRKPLTTTTTTSGSAGGKIGADEGPVNEADLPQGIFETLEVFVMEPRDLDKELRRPREPGGRMMIAVEEKRGKGTLKKGELDIPEIERSGLRMAVLTTLVRLLELKLTELESTTEGTGTLERDEALLAQHQRQGQGQDQGSSHSLSKDQLHAVWYRAGQKRLARAYLVYVSSLLQQEMKYLAKLTNENGKS